MYFYVLFTVDDKKSIYSWNIAISDTKGKVEQRYRSKYSDADIIVSEAFPWEIESAKEKGVPIVEVK